MRVRRLGVVQLTAPDNLMAASAEACAMIIKAAEAGADIIFTPETTHLMTQGGAATFDHAKSEEDDPGLASFIGLATALGVWLHIGSLIIKTANDRLVNRQYVISPESGIVARYDKLHLFDVDLGAGERYAESALYQPGDTLVTVDADQLVVGCSICFDLRFPDLYQRLAQGGAELLAVPSAFTRPTGEAHWETLLRARAIETGSFVVAAAQCGDHACGRKTHGHTLVVDPWGKVLLDAGEEPGCHIVNIDLDKVVKARRRMPNLVLRRDMAALPLTQF